MASTNHPEQNNRSGDSSDLAGRIASGKMVVTSELNPPKGIDLAPLLSSANDLRGYVDAFNVTDSHSARMCVSPLAVAHALAQHGHEPIVQLTTRDRNRIALQGDLLGAAVLGVSNVVLMGGDDPRNGDHPDAKAVFDISTEDLLRAANALTRGTDLEGNKLQGSPSLYIGAVVNPGATDLDRELERMADKIAAGAQFFQTQAIYDVRAFSAFADRLARSNDFSGVAVLAGIIPVKSVRMAEYMNENVPGIEVPQWVMQRVADAQDIEAESAAISAELIDQIRPLVQGIHLMAIGWERVIPTILERSKFAHRAPGGPALGSARPTGG
ncbi:MAG: methylenetetrahydrofolate reductase (NADPH) [Gammaproteobacteria bacterium]|jgi:methylenetetrahydrofolate reductase (NADPH)